MRKALCVGIDSYQNASDLHGCVNDANTVKSALERNGDGTLNFDVKLLCVTSEATYISRAKLKDASVLYYSGHGSFDTSGGYLAFCHAVFLILILKRFSNEIVKYKFVKHIGQ